MAKDVLLKLATKAASSVLGKFERKISWRGAARAGKGFTVFISNKDMDDVIRIVKSLENSDLFVDDTTETVNHEIIKKEDGVFPALIALMAASLVVTMTLY